jgi:3'-5' exoribonuclease
MIDYKQDLKNTCKKYSVFTDPVLDDPRFEIWSGAGSDKHHHYGDGGLLKHTHEVFEYVELIAMKHNSTCVGYENRINVLELLISVIWHDYGKIWDYQKDENGVWGKHNNHARQIHHISRSAIEWERYSSKLPIELWNTLEAENRVINPDNITHNILSHHGMREWGSPVAPATREAWVLHLADNLSARLDDCNKHDIIKH